MGAWTDSLGRVYAEPPAFANFALRRLALALRSESDSDTEQAVNDSQDAADYIVSWRRTLPNQGTRQPDAPEPQSTRDLLRTAMLMILFADEGDEDTATALRLAEAQLRTLWKRHRDAP